MVNAFSTNPSVLFQIRLQEDALKLRGSPAESVGCVLRGQLVLALKEVTKLRDVRLTFVGRSKVSWVDGYGANQTLHHERREVFRHEWVFLEPMKQFHVLQPANYAWDFELVLPGTLPETVDRCCCGYLCYELKAVAERTKFSKNLSTKRPVRVLRYLTAAEESMQGMAVTDVWSDRVGYDIALPSKVFKRGDRVSIDVCLQPLHPGLQLQSFKCKLQENITCVAKAQTHQESRTVHRIHNDDDAWSATRQLVIPTNTVCDSQNDIISVKHKLELEIVFLKEDSTQNKLLANIPIVVLPVSPHGDDMDLPAYEGHYLDRSVTPTDEHSDEHSSDEHSSYLLSNVPPFVDEQPLDFDLKELAFPPSYQSVANQIPAPLVDLSLPPLYNASAHEYQCH